MKRLSIIALVLVLTLSLVACGRRDNGETSAPTTTTPSTDMTIIPHMDPTLDTNIPDPNVDSSMPMYTEGTNSTDPMGETGNGGATTGMHGQSGRGY